jgi:hypothetical protein
MNSNKFERDTLIPIAFVILLIVSSPLIALVTTCLIFAGYILWYKHKYLPRQNKI